MNYEPIIGMEFHAQLKTNSKLFCGCRNDNSIREPNVNVCPLCLGMPGTLPVLNKRAVELVIKTGLALSGNIRKESKFDRKHYFYPDLPKAYQISQYDEPLVEGGFILGEDGKRKELTRIHLEEDTGRMSHPAGQKHSLVDYNRSGTPLMELVTEPVFRGASDAKFFAEELQRTLKMLDISDADMENGNMRCEANISLRKVGETDLPNYKVELKNINSFKSLEQGILYEIERQAEILDSGEIPKQETRGFDDEKRITFSQRSKEEAEDYRYFPEPDIPPLSLGDEFIEKVRSEITDLPWEVRNSLSSSKVNQETIDSIMSNLELIPLLKNLTNGFSENVSDISKFLAGDFQRIAGELKFSLHEMEEGFGADKILELLRIKKEGTISGKMLKEYLSDIVQSGEMPENYFTSRNMTLKSDEEDLRNLAKEIMSENPKALADFQSGNKNVLGFMVGQMMKKTKGQADPALSRKILEELLNS